MRPAEPDLAPDSVDPWVRWSWLMGSIWLVFLIFPVEAFLTSSYGTTVRAAGLLAVAAFAATYVAALVRIDRDASGPRWLTLGVLVALSALVIGWVGSEGLGMLIYVVAFAILALGRGAAIVVTLVVAAAIIGVSSARGDLGESWFLVLIMAITAVALVVVRVLGQRGESFRALREEVSLVAERERVARDVHDVLGHSLTVVTAKAELAERLVDLDPERAKAELAEIRSLTREALSEIRATVSGLRIARLGDELEAARRALDAAGITAEVPPDASEVDPRHRLTLAWVLREAVTNVVRHSGASRCVVRLQTTGLQVLDDGVGLAHASTGNGLRGISERVRAAGGQVRVENGPDGTGTLVEVSW